MLPSTGPFFFFPHIYDINGIVFKTIDRYIIKEIIPPFFIGLLISTFILLMNQILVLSEMFITRGVPLKTIIALLIYLIPSILAFAVPMSVLMGILAGMSRLSSDTEIMAFKTLGISYKRILRPILLFSLIGWIVTSLLTLYLAPRSNFKWIQSLSQSVLAKVQIKVNPREFNETIPNLVLFIQDIQKDRKWAGIFVHSSKNPEEPRVLMAKSGQLNIFPEKKRAILDLYDGVIHSFPLNIPGKYRVTSFEHLEEDIEMEGLFAGLFPKKRVREKDIKELYRDIKVFRDDLSRVQGKEKRSPVFIQKKRDYISHWVEFHKKLALPFACFVFAIIGLPLGASTRKGGRTSGFTLSLGIILVYYVLITAGEKFSIDGKIPIWLGIWGGNILIGFGGIYYFLKSMQESSPFSHWLRLFNFSKRKKQVAAKLKPELSKQQLPRSSGAACFPNILDRYITRKYLVLFVLILVGLVAVSIIVTFFERIDNIYEHNKPFRLFFEYIWYRIPEFIHYALPVTSLTASLLCLGIMTKFNEITAMKACGISVYRIIVPVIILGFAVSFFSFYIQENILPYSNKKQEELWSRINDAPPRSYSRLDRRWVLGKEKNRIYHYRYFDPIASAFSRISIYDIAPQTWSLTRRIYAEKAYFKGNTLLMVNTWSRNFEGDIPVTYERKDKVVLSDIEEKTYFVKEWKEPDQMNYGELKKYIQDIEQQGFETVKFRVELAYKISFPLACLIMTLLGIPFAFSMGKKGALVGLGISIIIAMLYWGTIGIFKSLGYIDYLYPLLAAWAPNLFFGLIGIYLILTLKT
ncbi:MAG: LPS export ABC transporter permease LptF [Acidobacteriota bacterium]|nr:LPS export ABC transporter permease LptF [Acidobacteriota bacterium]